jgi:hypothetical protein
MAEVFIEIQAALLSYIGQQLVSHAATLVALLLIAFTLLRYFPTSYNWKWKRDLWSWARIMITAILFTLATYTVLRMIWYGHLANAVMSYAPSQDSSCSNFDVCWMSIKHHLEQQVEMETNWLRRVSFQVALEFGAPRYSKTALIYLDVAWLFFASSIYSLTNLELGVNLRSNWRGLLTLFGLFLLAGLFVLVLM